MTASAPASAQRSGVIAPYGGSLVDLMVPEAERAEYLAAMKNLPKLTADMLK